MEGVVRQIWKADAATEICFVYTMHEGMTNDLAAGRFPRSASAMEHIADHYGIPSIHLAMEAARRIRVGEWIFKSPKPDVPADPDRGFPARKAFAPDGCHPFAETGHRLYTEALARAFERMENLGQPGAHALPEPFTPDNHENAMMILLSRDFLIGSWWKLDRTTNALARNFARQLPVLWQATEAGDSLRFSFHGRWAALYDLLGPDGGCKVQANAGPGQKSRRPKVFRRNSPLASLLLSQRSARDIFLRRASPCGHFWENSAPWNFQTGSKAAPDLRSSHARNA